MEIIDYSLNVKRNHPAPLGHPSKEGNLCISAIANFKRPFWGWFYSPPWRGGREADGVVSFDVDVGVGVDVI